MSGPLKADDVEEVATSTPPLSRVVEVRESRRTQVGDIPIRRALPQRDRRTVGAWCFFDHGGPVTVTAGEGGVGPHPHIGLQTVTWVFEGELLHRDSLGSEQPVRAGELNLMTAGHGVVHAEEHIRSGVLHLAQLWVAQPAGTRSGAPAFEHHADLPELDLDGGTATIFVGGIGDVVSPARQDTDHIGVDMVVDHRTVLPVDRRFEYVVVPIEGGFEVDGQTLDHDKLMYLGTGRDEVRLEVLDSVPARALVLGGLPFEEQVLMWWNYVARTREEIISAHRDWTSRSERFPEPTSTLAAIDVSPPPWAGVD